MPTLILGSFPVVWTSKLLVLEETLSSSIWLSPITVETLRLREVNDWPDVTKLGQAKSFGFFVRFPLLLKCLFLPWRRLSKGLINPIITHFSLGADSGKYNQILLQNKNSPLGGVSEAQPLWLISATTRQGVGNFPFNAHIPASPFPTSPNNHYNIAYRQLFVKSCQPQKGILSHQPT